MALPIFQRTIVDDTGDVIPLAQVEVRLESTNALATLYSDRAGTTALANPFNASSEGLAVFFAEAGEYSITATGSGNTVTWRYVALSPVPGSTLKVKNAYTPTTMMLPRTMKKIIRRKDNETGTIKIVGMGSSVGYGAVVGEANAPVVKFAEYFNQKINRLGNFDVQISNRSVNGSTLSDGYSIIDDVLSEEEPDILYLVYGMNDAGYLNYYAGQTFPFVYSRLALIIQKAQAAGCDVIVTTTPHQLSTSLPTTFHPAIPASYPEIIAAPVDGEQLHPPLSELAVRSDWTGDGVEFDQYYLARRVNQSMIRCSIDHGVPVINTEEYWFEAVKEHGESNLYSGTENVHPNLLGHQLSYWRGAYDFVDSLSNRFFETSGQRNLTPRVGINRDATDAALDVKSINSVDDLLKIRDYLDNLITSMEPDGHLKHRGALSVVGETANPEFIMTSYFFERAFVRTVRSNRNLAVPIVLSTAPGQFGEITYQASQSGIGTQLRKFAYYNVGGTITLTPNIYYLETSTLDVVTTVINGNDIELTPFTSGTTLDYIWEYS